jgi:hypothetical protein
MSGVKVAGQWRADGSELPEHIDTRLTMIMLMRAVFSGIF